MEVKITDDSIELIASYLSPISRLNLAAVNEQFYNVCTIWRDVKTIILDTDDITLAAPNMIHKYPYTHRQSSIRAALQMSPGIKRLIVQTRLKESDIAVLNEHPSLISKLYISTENVALQEFPVFRRLRTLHIVANSMKDYRVNNTIGPNGLQTCFPACLRRLCLTDVTLTANLMEFIGAQLPNLTFLDMIGCLVDTLVAPKYLESLEKCISLEELSLPPSFFSFTCPNRKLDSDKKISFKKLTLLKKISLYMDLFHEDTFHEEIRTIMPTKLVALVVFGNYIPLKRWKRLKELKRFLVIFGPNEAIASCPQANLCNVKLLSHLVRRPPYSMQRSFVSPLDFTIENISWRFSLVEWQTQNGQSSQPPPPPPERFIINDDADDPLRILRRLNRLQENPNPIHPATPLPAAAAAAAATNNINNTTQQRQRHGRHGRSTSAPHRGAQGGGTHASPTRRRVAHERERRLQSTPNRSDSMRTHPPTPTGISTLRPTPIIQEIPMTSTGTLNRAFAQPSTGSNISELTSSPERLPLAPAPTLERGARIEPSNEGAQMIVETLANNADLIIPPTAPPNAPRSTVAPPPRE